MRIPLLLGLIASALLLGISTYTSENSLTPQARAKIFQKNVPAQHLMAARNYPYKTTDYAGIRQSQEMAQSRMNSRNTSPGLDASWTIQGPTNIGGRINTIAVHPTNSDIRFIGASAGGIWKTTDAGATWQPVFDEHPRLAIGDIIFDPQHPDTLYAGTGDPNIAGYFFIGDGVYRSVDAGDSWQYIGLRETGIVSSVWVDPRNDSVILAGTMGIPSERNNDRGMYRSTDFGQTWQQVLFVADQAGIIDIVQEPNDPDVLLASSWDRVRNERESLVAGGGTQVWRSTDAGGTWQSIQNNLPIGPSSGRIALGVSQVNPYTFFALNVGPSTQQAEGLYKTEDGGNTWSTLPIANLDSNALGGFGWYFGKIGISPADDNDIFVLGVNLHRTIDGGNDWNLAAPPWFVYDVHADKHDIHFITPNHILLATDGGLFETFDGGVNWQRNGFLPITQFYRVAHNPNVPNEYYGGAQDNGSTGGDNTFMDSWPRIFGGDGFQMNFDPTDPQRFWAQTQNGNLVYTLDGGQFFDREDLGLFERSNWDMPWLLSQHNPLVLYAGRQRVSRTIEGGNGMTWDTISTILPTQDPNLLGSTRTISAMGESPITPMRVYAGTGDAQCYVTDDFGATWQDVSMGLPNRYITSLKGSPTDSLRIFVTHSGVRYNDATPHVHRSDDFGQTWIPIAGDLPPVPVNSLYILPNTNDEVLVAATDAGVFASVNGGVNWEVLGDMPLIPVYDLGENPAEQTLVAGTHARSIQTYPLDSLRKALRVVSNDNPLAQAKIKVFPNPATSYIQVEATPSLSPQSSARLWDMQGRVMHTWSRLGNGRLDVPALKPGTYILDVAGVRKQVVLQ